MKAVLQTVLVLLFGALLTAGCGASEERSGAGDQIFLETRGDSLAMRTYRAHGGPETWQNVPNLAFTFAIGREQNQRTEVAQHWWNRRSGDYRVEWTGGTDSTYTAVFNVNDFGEEPPPGHTFLNGARLDSTAETQALLEAHHRFANDTYWLLAPLKLFDEGVHRAYAADSAQKSGFDVLTLSFDSVGITPGDRYWLTADSTGHLERWTFSLQGMGQEEPPGTFRWTGYETFTTPAGLITLSTRKESASGPSTIYTDEIRTPAQLPDSLFQIAN